MKIKQTQNLINHINHLIKACGYSLSGLKSAFQNDIAFRQEVYLTVVLIPLALFLGASSVEKSVLIGSWLLVLVVELINSAIESVVDRVSLDIHPLSKRIKDVSSAAVLLAIVNAVIVWVIIVS